MWIADVAQNSVGEAKSLISLKIPCNKKTLRTHDYKKTCKVVGYPVEGSVNKKASKGNSKRAERGNYELNSTFREEKKKKFLTFVNHG